MTEFMVSSVLEAIELLLGYKKVILIEEEHLQGIKTDLIMMQDFLMEFSGSRRHRRLISQVREMVHDTELIFDTLYFSTSEALKFIHVRNFYREIESIRSRFREINFQTGVEEEAEDVGPEQEQLAPDDEEDAVGLEKVVEKMINEVVLDSDGWFMKSMITGMGGIGKTTLARQLYNHAFVVERFECRGWACVSSGSVPEEVLRVLIRQVVVNHEEELMEKMDMESLQLMLLKHLTGTRYLVVLDDVWEDASLNCVLDALPREYKSSKVLLTGRSSNIERGLDYIFNMDHLDSHVSWQLFLKMVFTYDHKCPNHLTEIGRQIVKKCNGLPIAIKEVGRQLATKIHSKSAWQEFLGSMNFSKTLAVLESSYHRLSSEQKSCFLQMSFFKEGTTIRAQKFLHMRNAAGMVTRLDERYQTMEDQAGRYFQKLYRESMIMMMEYSTCNALKCFRLDGFLHKISIKKAGEEIGFEILGCEEYSQRPCKPSHRAIYCSRENFNYSTTQDKYLLSLFFYGGGNFDAKLSHWESFTQLRILDFESFGLKMVPEAIYNLVRLRYLGLRDNYIQKITNTLGYLKDLEVLDIALNFMVEVPDALWEMDSLRHLYMSDIICRTPLKIDSLVNLQTLAYISVNNIQYKLTSLEMMTSLRTLGIEELVESSDVSKLFTSLAKLKNLDYLKLRGSRFRSMPPLDDLSVLDGITRLKLDGRLTKLPKFPKGIRSLILINSYLDRDLMPELEKLSKLKSLKLRNAYTGQQMEISHRGLRELSFLCIKEMPHLKILKRGDNVESLPSLLKIYSCPYLNNIPKEIITFGPLKLEKLRIVTTRKIAKVIRKSGITFMTDVEIQP